MALWKKKLIMCVRCVDMFMKGALTRSRRIMCVLSAGLEKTPLKNSDFLRTERLLRASLPSAAFLVVCVKK